MKLQWKACALVCFTLLCACIACAQTAKETWVWVESFVTENGGDKNGHDFGVNALSKGNTFMFYADLKKIAVWNTNNDENDSFVRLTGVAHDCEDVEGSGGEDFIRSHCASSNKTMDIELKDNRAKSLVLSVRLSRALIHMAELAGAKVNEKELF